MSLRAKRSNPAPVLIVAALICSGCMQMRMLPYLDQALTLQAMSKEKEGQEKYVKNADAGFDRMLDAVASGKIHTYTTEEGIIKAFGPPVVNKTVTVDGQPLKRSLYRYAIQSKGPKKVYVYYGPGGQVVKIQPELLS